ncbi:hypothetical protein F7R91_34250 [Streptomyces luteolifulvus]|uniref:Uncharacterized protein n=1 Tax=Streptomyces luteolifulvus TaxID=2615112 RepID=A0A6H9USV5_9ACTN|nr:hypothetical protein [Streptomyces luteolifulvus]KAB1140907.1 hypothetical protein F7R91_34250 [Streptomyces luteolifulvus]
MSDTSPGLKVSSAVLTRTINELDEHLSTMERAYTESEDIARQVAQSMRSTAGTKFIAKIENWQRGYRTVMAEYKDLLEAVGITSKVMTDTAGEADANMDLWTGDVYDILGK